ncbi:MAG: ABC transporter ATP-binding protein [Longimicrobiales bacterium]
MTRPLPTSIENGPFVVRSEGLRKTFGKDIALSGVDLQVPEGAVYVLVGPNGAGKSTLLRVLMNMLHADSGKAEVLGLDSHSHGPEVRAQIGYVPEDYDGGYPWIPTGRLLEHQAAYFPSWDQDYFKRLADLFELQLDRRFGKLSKGQARRVQLAMALAHRPPLLVLDEPTDGLDPIMRDETLALLAEHIADTPTTVLMSTHRVYEVERLADHVGLLRGGRLVSQLPREDLRRLVRRYQVQVPDGWAGIPSLDASVIRRSGSGREVEWTVWGDEAEVSDRLTAAGAVVRDISPLSLDEAAIALLAWKGA